MPNPKVIVVFRVFTGKDGGDVVALFPELPADNAGRYCESYQHIGQHGGADYEGLMRHGTRPATVDESAALEKELRAAPYHYRLDVRHCAPRGYRERRYAAARVGLEPAKV